MISSDIRVGDQLYDAVTVFLNTVRIANVPTQEFIQRVALNGVYQDVRLALMVVDQSKHPGLVRVGFTPSADGDWNVTLVSPTYNPDGWVGTYKVRGTDALATYQHIERIYQFVEGMESALSLPKSLIRTNVDAKISSVGGTAPDNASIASTYTLLQSVGTTQATIDEKIYNFIQGVESRDSVPRSKIDVAISSRSTLTQSQILSDATPFSGADINSIKTFVDSLETWIGNPSGDSYATLTAKENELLRRLTDDRARYLENLAGSNVAHDDKLQLVLNQVRKIDLDPVAATSAPGSVASYLEDTTSLNTVATVAAKIYAFVQGTEISNRAMRSTVTTNLDVPVSTRAVYGFTDANVLNVYTFVEGMEAALSNPKDIIRTKIDAAVSSRAAQTDMDTVLGRLTVSRAGYLDNLSGSNVAHDDKLQAVLNQVQTNSNTLGTVSTTASNIYAFVEGSEAADQVVRGVVLSNLDVKVSSRAIYGFTFVDPDTNRTYLFVEGMEAALSLPKDIIRTRIDVAVSTRSTLAQSDILSDATPFKGGDIAKIYSIVQTMGDTHLDQNIYTFVQGVESRDSVPRSRLDVAVSSRSTLTQGQILSDATPFSGADISAIKTFVDSLETWLGDPSGDAYSTIKAKENEILRRLTDLRAQYLENLAGSNVAHDDKLSDVLSQVRKIDLAAVTAGVAAPGSLLTYVEAISTSSPGSGADATLANQNTIISKIDSMRTEVDKIYSFEQGSEATKAVDESLVRTNLDVKVSSRAVYGFTDANILNVYNFVEGMEAALSSPKDIIRTKIDASVSSRASQTDVDTLLSRLTASRAGYLENLAGSNVAHDDKLQAVLVQAQGNATSISSVAATANSIYTFVEGSEAADQPIRNRINTNLDAKISSISITGTVDPVTQKIYDFVQYMEQALSLPKDIIRTRLDVAVSTRSTLTQANILTDATPFAGADILAIKTFVDSLETWLGNPSGDVYTTITAKENELLRRLTDLRAQYLEYLAGSNVAHDDKLQAVWEQVRKLDLAPVTGSATPAGSILSYLESTSTGINSASATLANQNTILTNLAAERTEVDKIYSFVQGTEALAAVSQALIRSRLDVAVSSRSTLAQSDILSDATPFAGATISKIYTFVQGAEASDSPARARILGLLDVAVSSRAASVSADPNIQNIYNFVEGVEAISGIVRERIRQLAVDRLTASRAAYLDFLAGSNVAHDDKLEDIKNRLNNLSVTAGTYTVTLRITDSGSSARLPGVRLTVADSTDANVLSVKITDGNGEATFSLDAGTYKVRISGSGYSFTTPQTFAVTANATFTFSGSALNPSTPSDPAKCTVYGWIVDAQGNIQSGVSVKFTIIDTDVFTSGGKLVRKEDEIVTTDAAGYFEIQLFRSAQLVPSGAKYKAHVPSIGFAAEIVVPDQATALLKSLV